MREQIRDRKTGEQLGWVENGRDVYSLKTEKRFAVVGENGNLFDLEGRFLNLHLENLDAVPSAQSGTTTELDTFRKLAGFA